MSEKKQSNWFPVRKRVLVITILYLCAAVIAINPTTMTTATAGGTALIAILSIILQSSSPFLAFLDALMPDKKKETSDK